MSKFGIIATNLVTALVTAAATSLFWVAAYGNKGANDAPEDKARIGRAKVQAVEGLVIGPAGLAIPVAGMRADQLVDTYSQARAGGARVHDAIDIMAPHGTPVVAAAPGVVEKLFFSEGGGGITAYVRSPDGKWVYYYAHLRDYAPGLREGQQLRRGAPVGTVGSSGNANPAGPHLHFAIHRMSEGERWHQGSPVNPYPLLAGGKRGG